MNLLLVEDDPRIATFLLRALKGRGHAVEAVATGAEALVRATRHEALDLVVLDLGLPDMDGLDVLQRLRAAGVRAPVVVLTAREEEDDRETALARGAEAYLVKPVPLPLLLDTLEGAARAA